MAHTATTDADDIRNEIGIGPSKIATFRAKASTSYTKGDFVTIDTNGRVVLASTNGQNIDGIVNEDVDNSSGADDALTVPVLIQGAVKVDGLFSATGGTFDDTISIGTQLGVAGDSGTTADNAQALVVTPGGSANKQFTSLTIHALPSSGNELVTVYAYFQGHYYA